MEQPASAASRDNSEKVLSTHLQPYLQSHNVRHQNNIYKKYRVILKVESLKMSKIVLHINCPIDPPDILSK